MLSMTTDKKHWWERMKARIGLNVKRPRVASQATVIPRRSPRVGRGARNEPAPESRWDDYERYIETLRAENKKLQSFRVGMRVASNIDGGQTKGTVTELHRGDWTMMVLIDGDSKAQSWWRGYWELDE